MNTFICIDSAPRPPRSLVTVQTLPLTPHAPHAPPPPTSKPTDYLRYRNVRASYLSSWVGLVDWAAVQRNYGFAVAGRVDAMLC